jgi:predicted ester cyclase
MYSAPRGWFELPAHRYWREHTMSVEDYKVLAQQYVEAAFSDGNLAILDTICAPTHIHHGIGGIAEVKALITYLRMAFPDVHFSIEDMIAEGDKVAYRWILRGTHQGEFADISPTGKAVIETGITILRIAEGKIVEGHYEVSSPGLEQQLGSS